MKRKPPTLAARCSDWLAHLLAIVVRLLRKRPRHHLLLAAPGAGNIGDQAMLEAFLNNVGGFTIVVTRRNKDVTIPDNLGERARAVTLPGLVYGGELARLRAIFKLSHLLLGARSFSVIGADIMDGHYNRQASVNRARLARFTSKCSVDTRVLGFSWNAHAAPDAVLAVKNAASAGARLYLRDPISFQRLQQQDIAAETVADLAFSIREIDTNFPELELVRKKPCALVNVSALIGQTFNQAAEYVRVIDDLREKGLHVVLVPHVSRASGCDIAACREVHTKLRSGDVDCIARLLSPAQIRALAAQATLVITGRMHLAILALTVGTPPITLGTQGKVEGLMQLFDASELCVTAQPGFGDDIKRIADRITSTPEDWRHEIRLRLPTVQALSAKNFEGLR